MQADGTDQRRLTRHIAHDGFPSWSPDSKKIAFMSDRESNPEIYVTLAPHASAGVNADGSNLQRLTDNAGDDTDPDWSPDGTRIVFVSNRDGNDELYLMSADGRDPRRLTYEKANDWQPAWRPALPRK
jgi:Tol biopolymer transport system component